MNYECIVEIFEGINVKIKFDKDSEDNIDVKKVFLLLKDNTSVEMNDLDQDTIESLVNLVLDEVESIPFKDSTVKFDLEFPN